MAFVTCKQLEESQEAQDTAFEQSQAAQDKKIIELASDAISAEDSLLDKSIGEGGGEVTVEKIKQAIAGDVSVAVKPNSGITGNGTQDSPLALSVGDGLTVTNNGKLKISPTEAGEAIGSTEGGQSLLQALKDNNLLGDGLDVINGKLVVKTTRFVDASGQTLIGYGVDKGE